MIMMTREAISVHMTPHLTHLTRLSAAEGLGHNLMAGIRWNQVLIILIIVIASFFQIWNTRGSEVDSSDKETF